MKKLPKEFERYFWEIDTAKLDVKKDDRYIIDRIIEYGRPEAIRWLFARYTKKQIFDVVGSSRSVSSRTKNFWNTVFS